MTTPASLSRLFPAVAAILLASTVFACEDSSVGTQPSPVGEWHLAEFAGQELPVVIEQSQGTVTELTEGSIVFSQDGTCADELVMVRTQEDGGTSPIFERAECTWTRTRDTVVLTRPGGGRISGLLEPGTLTIGTGSATLVFRR